MFCKYLGTINTSDIPLHVRSSLKQPGDLIGYHIGEQPGILNITYKRSIVFFEGSISYQPKPFVSRPSSENDCYRNLKIKNLFDNPGELLQHIQQRLITLIVFDFDQTLTVTHTFHRPDKSDIDKKNNLVYPEEIKLLLKEISKNPNYSAIIISNNFKAVIETYLKLWFGEEKFFQAVYSREDFHDQKEGDKEICVLKYYKQFCDNISLDSEGCVQLDNLIKCRAIDFVSVLIVDDDPRPSFRPAGLKIIKPTVPSSRSFLIELKYLLNIRSLEYNPQTFTNIAEALAFFKCHHDDNDDPATLDMSIKNLMVKFEYAMCSSLCWAVRSNFLRLADFYVQRGDSISTVDDSNLTPVLEACLNTDVSMLKVLLNSKQPYIESVAQPIILTAVQTGCCNTLSYVLNLKRFDINAVDKSGLSAIHYACIAGSSKMVTLLSDAGADINQRTMDVFRRSALHICVVHNKRQACLTLLAANADVFVQDQDGFNPCQFAAFKPNVQFYELLATRTGSRINDYLSNGRTLLTHSILTCTSEFTFSLSGVIKEGLLDFNLVDQHGETPLRLAQARNFKIIAGMLIKAGAKDPDHPQDKEASEATMAPRS